MPKLTSSTSSASNSFREQCRPGGGFDDIIAESASTLIDDANSDEELEIVITLRIDENNSNTDIPAGTLVESSSRPKRANDANDPRTRAKIQGYFDPSPVVDVYRKCKVHGRTPKSRPSQSAINSPSDTLADVTMCGGGSASPACRKQSQLSCTGDEESSRSHKENNAQSDASKRLEATMPKKNDEGSAGSEGRLHPK
ncbi:hypothetical protein AAVH_02322 [Aphelenchoides avenae]|nr:hypothetical protein AAVH_02322 [Aphelenchus avenae]